MLLVPALAWMQYQWLGQLSTAERERMQRTLRTAAAQFATEFDTELSRTLVSLQVDGADDSRSELDRVRAALFGVGHQRRASRGSCAMCGWSIRCPAPRCRRSTARTPIPVDRLRLRKWNAQALTFEDAEWPDDLQQDARFAGDALHRLPGAARPRLRAPGTHREAALSLSLGDDNTLIAPVTLFEMPDDHRGPPKISILGFTIVRLDPVVIRDTLLAALTTRHFHGDDAEVDYRVAVVQKDDPSKRGLGIGAGHRGVGHRGAGRDAGLHGAAAGSDVRVRAEPARRSTAAATAAAAVRREPGTGSRDPAMPGCPDPASRLPARRTTTSSCR